MTDTGHSDEQRTGRDFLFALHAALRALRLYPMENQAVQNALRDVRRCAQPLFERDGSIELRYVGDFCFVNDVRLRADLGSFATFGAVSRLLASHGIGQLHIGGGITAQEWTALLSLLLSPPVDEEPFEHFVGRLGRSTVQHVEVSPEEEAGNRTRAPEHSREAAKQTYIRSVAVAREAMNGVRMGKGVSVRRVKRAVQQMVDQVLNNESSIIGMTVLRDYDEYTFGHCVNVCIFSIALGKKLGFSRPELYELGMGALMHDIGKMHLPLEVTNKEEPLTDEEWALIREHPTEGLLTLMEMRGLGDLPLRAMLTTYEHHMKVDQTGYPRSVRPRSPTIFSHIVSIADGFDAATSKRSYQSEPWLPDRVLRGMRDNPERGFDPLLVKAFISMTGFYPVGSLVILDSYELAVVVAPTTRPDCYHQPW
ncbi:MAG TPA: HD domain-containing phosphohydrolase [Longimicrobiaceae bacterium]|nr:HD domain-containing phosphohydrolase [Longimicrobiaceae bacterium]